MDRWEVYTYQLYTYHALPRACDARLGQIVQELLKYAVLCPPLKSVFKLEKVM